MGLNPIGTTILYIYIYYMNYLDYFRVYESYPSKEVKKIHDEIKDIFQEIIDDYSLVAKEDDDDYLDGMYYKIEYKRNEEGFMYFSFGYYIKTMIWQSLKKYFLI